MIDDQQQAGTEAPKVGDEVWIVVHYYKVSAGKIESISTTAHGQLYYVRCAKELEVVFTTQVYRTELEAVQKWAEDADATLSLARRRLRQLEGRGA